MADKWDRRFLWLAEQIGTWSKDPSTKVGAVIVRPNRTICSVGYNGFPRNMNDDEALYKDRNVKYSRTIHAEINAILNSNEDVEGYALYTHPFFPCDRCAVHIIQSGINRVVAPVMPAELIERWQASLNLAVGYFREAGVGFEIVADNVVYLGDRSEGPASKTDC